MSKLSSIKRGKEKLPPRIIVHGQEGVGKSTFASMAPNPIFIQTEDGLGEIDCAKFPLAESFEDVIENLTELAVEEHDFRTVVIDTLDWLEPLVVQSVCQDYGVDSILKAAGGFNQGYVKAVDKWANICTALDYLRRERNMTVIMIAHSKVKDFKDPENPAYDRYVLRLNDRAAEYLVEWADCVLFACKKVTVSNVDDGKRNIARPVGNDGGERILRTVASPTCTAKNRYNLPSQIALDWEEFANNIK